MSGLWFIRPAGIGDLDAVMELAKLTGAGFTNLPPNRESLARRLHWSDESFARAEEKLDNELYMLVLEEAGTGRIGGSALIFARVGVDWPFYSYKLSKISQQSQELGRTITTEVLHLVNDFDGATEVGGLFLHPDLRTGGLGRLLAQSRYMFIGAHRQRFADRVIAELRGLVEKDGSSPFWQGLGAKFFGMTFQEADTFNALNGNQFIADLMPKYPIYTALLSDTARDAIGKPHEKGMPAMRMLEKEGFSYSGYVDVFDGGPTMAAPVERLRTVREARALPVASVCEPTAAERRGLASTGRLGEFRAWQCAGVAGEEGLTLPAEESALFGLTTGDVITYVAP